MENLVTIPSRVPCPEWCTEAPGHPYDDPRLEGGAFSRMHRAEVGPYVSVTVAEHAATPDGPTVLAAHEPPAGYWDEAEYVTDPLQMRAAAADLLTAADLLGQLIDATR